MNNIFKQFAGLVTKWKNDLFFRAELKLTAWYSLGILFLLAILSVSIITVFSNNFPSKEEWGEGSERHDSFIEESIEESVNEHLFNTIVQIDLIFSFLLIIASFFISKKTIKPLREASRREKMFTADVAHEFRTPLAVMKTGTEVAIHKNDLDYFNKISHENLEEIDSLASLLDDLIFLIKNNSFRRKEKTKFSLTDLVQKEIQLIKEYSKNNEVNIVSEVENNVFIVSNEGQIKRLLKNIIKNAIDYNKTGGSVYISLCGGKKISLKIKDTGIGLSKEEIKHIFDRFFKADSSRSRTNNGSGLGLAIVKEICDENGILINVKSEVGEGTVFELIF